MHSGTQLHKREVSFDEDDVEPPRMRFDAMSFKPSSKVDSQSSSSVFANRPIGALLRPNNQKDVQAPALKSSTFSVRPKAPEQQPPSQDMSAVLAKLSSMENRIMSLVENKISSLEKKVDASERRTVATAKAIDGIGTLVENHIANGLKVSRDDLEYVMGLINDCTKESGSFLFTQIEEIREKIANMNNHTVPDNVVEEVQINNNEVVVIAANNPHDTIHRTSAEELMSIIEGHTVYVCSSL
uniref:Uncharacterized protein n=1 Tax=Physcomitrium patens TaxID=3218 RepID=A0A2K1J7A8_PHYPA|nr:hypothetical protein PHYPA_020534 [Physcomitrium patens]